MSDIVLHTKDLDTLIRIERPAPDESFDGAGSGGWAPVDEIWASVRDILPSRPGRLPEGINFAARPARIRMRYRDDIKDAMRIVIGSRIMQIVSGPVTLGRRAGLELIAEEYAPAGNSA